MSKSRPVLIAHAVLAGAGIVVAGAAFSDVVGIKVAALLVLIVAGGNVTLGFLTQEKVTPNEDVAALVQNGQVVAGQAAAQTTGTPVTVSAPRSIADSVNTVPAATESTDQPGA